jgi:hypothetical protein
MVLVTVRVLPFLLTVVLIRSVTLLVSTLGVRSYSDQRYSSMHALVRLAFSPFRSSHEQLTQRPDLVRNPPGSFLGQLDDLR